MNPATQHQFQVGQHVSFLYTRSDGEQSFRSGVVHRVHEWGVVLFDDDRQQFRSFRFNRMASVSTGD